MGSSVLSVLKCGFSLIPSKNRVLPSHSRSDRRHGATRLPYIPRVGGPRMPREWRRWFRVGVRNWIDRQRRFRDEIDGYFSSRQSVSSRATGRTTTVKIQPAHSYPTRNRMETTAGWGASRTESSSRCSTEGFRSRPRRRRSRRSGRWCRSPLRRRCNPPPERACLH